MRKSNFKYLIRQNRPTLGLFVFIKCDNCGCNFFGFPSEFWIVRHSTQRYGQKQTHFIFPRLKNSSSWPSEMWFHSQGLIRIKDCWVKSLTQAPLQTGAASLSNVLCWFSTLNYNFKLGAILILLISQEEGIFYQFLRDGTAVFTQNNGGKGGSTSTLPSTGALSSWRVPNLIEKTVRQIKSNLFEKAGWF